MAQRYDFFALVVRSSHVFNFFQHFVLFLIFFFCYFLEIFVLSRYLRVCG
nr:MAG TPA: hypothetical protein [Caudoviricetes sp.]